MFENVIFDFDGTLANTVSASLNALRQTFREFDVLYDETKLNKRLFVIPLVEYYKLISENVPEDKWDAVLFRYRELRNKNIEAEAYAYPHMEGLLKRLKANRCNLFIATNSSKNTFARVLDLLFKDNLFDDFRAAEGTKPEMVENLIKTHNLDKSKTVMIGDGLGDIAAGNSAGIKTIAVGWGYEEDKELLKNAADFYVETVEELSSILL